MLGHVDVISRTLIEGWAADPSRPGSENFVRITVNGRRFRVAANLPRAGLETLFPGATGQYGFRLDSDQLNLSPFVTHDVDVVFVRTDTSVPGGKAVLPAVGSSDPTASPGSLAPIVVSSTGRSGSSLLMARLAQHPDIVVAREHPHELMLLNYYALAFRTLVSEADFTRSSRPETMNGAENRFHIGFNPYHDHYDAGDAERRAFWQDEAPDRLSRTFGGLIHSHYSLVGRQQGKVGARFFAEKISTSDLAREAAAFMFGAVHEIVLVRDPRDVICSSKSFWQRDFASSLTTLRGQLAGMTKQRQPNVRQHLLRYEDLLKQPERTFLDVLRFLGLTPEAPALDGEREAAVFRKHATSATPMETIGRWRQDLTPEQAAIATREMLPVLEQFGYPLS